MSKKIKMTLGEAVDAYDVLSGIVDGKDDEGKPLNRLTVEVAWQIQEMMDAIHPHQEKYQKVFDKLLKDYGEPIKDQPGKLQVKDVDKFSEEANTLSSKEVEVEIVPLKLKIVKGLRLANGSIRTLYKHKMIDK